MKRRVKHLALAVATAAALSGCGLTDPYADKDVPTAERQTRPVDNHEHPADVTSGVTTDPKAGGDARGAERIAREFAATTATYSPDTWTAQQKALRARATGQMAHDLEPVVPDSDTQRGLAESQLTSRASVLTSEVEQITHANASVIVVLRVITGDGGHQNKAPAYPVYRVKLNRTAGAWKVAAMDAP